MRLAVTTLLVFVAGSGFASARELTLTLGGDEYQGPPKYQVLADGVQVGEGAVVAKSGQIVTVDVGNPMTLAIRFTNDAAGPVGVDGVRPPGTDRNLIVEKIELDGIEIPLTDLAPAPGLILRRTLVVSSEQTVAIPLDGLPQVTDVVPAPASSVSEPAKAETINIPTENFAAPTEIVEAPVPSCEVRDVTLTGYANGVVEPSAEALAPLIALSAIRHCAVTVTGFSSSAGPADLNLSMAEQRAKAIVKELVKKGVAADNIEIVPFGATTQFGPTQADNRRVIVNFRPRTR